jgi:hypothetical protein
MDLATKLAQICVLAEDKEGLPELRGRFEASAAKEKLLRRHAQRWEELAKERAESEDTSLGGFAGTAAGRMLPIPHTGFEAFARLPAIAAGTVGGYHYGKGLEGLKGEDVLRAFRPPAGGKKGRTGGTAAHSPMEGPINELVEWRRAHYGRQAVDQADLRELLRDLSLGPEMRHGDVAKAFASKKVPTSWNELKRSLTLPKGYGYDELKGWLKNLGYAKPETLPSNFTPAQLAAAPGHTRMRSQIEHVLGPGSIDVLRPHLEAAIKSTAAKKGPIAEVLPRLSGKGVLGAVGGGALAATATGLPFAALALLRKLYGGESAVRARAKAREALSGAGKEEQIREELLQQLEKGRKA